MKKRQATSRDIQVGSPSSQQGIEPLQPQLNRQQTNCWQLAASAKRINQLSAELEAALFEFKDVAGNIKQHPPKMASRWDYQAIAIPYIHYKRPGLFVLKARTVDLCAEEKAAFALAQQLRKRTKTRLRRSKSSMSLANISWRLRKFLQMLRQLPSAIVRQPRNNRSKKIDLHPAAKTTKMESRKRFVLQR